MRSTVLFPLLLLTLLDGGVVRGVAQLQFTTTKIGGGAPGSFPQDSQSPGSYIVIGGGNDIWSAADEFTFHYFPKAGNFDIRARVESLEPNAPKTKAGLMLRGNVNRK